MRTGIIHNATIVALEGGQARALRGHSVAFSDGIVTESAPSADLQARVNRGEFANVIAGERYLVVPGLVNTHHHLYQSLTRCLPAVQNEQLFGWLVGLYQRWRSVDYRAVKLAAQVSLAELLLSGCTTTSDHFYLFPRDSDVRAEAVLEAAEEIGIRIHLCRGAMTLGESKGGLPPDELVEDDAHVLSDCQRVINRYHDPRPHAMRRIDLAPCSPFNCTPELLRDTAVLARERGVLLHTHLAETLDEERYCQERFGCRPLRYIADRGLLGPDVYLAHCVYLNASEIGELARTGAAVSHCPTSNLRLGSGICPLRDLRAAGVRVGLGVDGSSSNDGGSMLATVKQTLLVARLSQVLKGPVGRRVPLVEPRMALELATAGGAACLRREELGHLNVGAAADFAMYRLDDPGLAGAAAQDPVAALVLCDAPRAESVFVSGREVVRDGRIVALDAYALGREFNELVAERFTGP